ncbi:MAG: hypothetical protein P1U35_10665 [Cycloclasticus sp.]|nr:hypothetical protein [Cycloclasticus sp.]
MGKGLLIFIGIFWVINATASSKDKWEYMESIDSFNASITSDNTSAQLLFTCVKGVDSCTTLMHVPSMRCEGSIHSLAITQQNSMPIPMYCMAHDGFKLWVFELEADKLLAFLSMIGASKYLTLSIPLEDSKFFEIRFNLNGSMNAISKVISNNAKIILRK